MPFRRVHNTSDSWDLFLWAAWCRWAQPSHPLSRTLFWGHHGHIWSSHLVRWVFFPGLFVPSILWWAIWIYLHWFLSCAECVFGNESFLLLKVVTNETTSSFAIILLLNEISPHPTISEEKSNVWLGAVGSVGYSTNSVISHNLCCWLFWLCIFIFLPFLTNLFFQHFFVIRMMRIN